MMKATATWLYQGRLNDPAKAKDLPWLTPHQLHWDSEDYDLRATVADAASVPA